MGAKCSKCRKCKEGNHKHCEDPNNCSCKCNEKSVVDAIKKGGAIVGGAGVAVGGLAMTVLSGGLLIPVGGALMGAGISSVYQGVEKTIKNERIDGVGFCADVGFGAVTGVLTGGIGATGEVVAAKAVQQGAMVGAKKLVVRTGAGVVAGVVSKVVDETKECTMTHKKWSDFGQTVDEDGKVNGTATATSWAVSGLVGGLGGIGGHISSNATKQVSSGIAKSAVRIGVSGASAAVGDTAVQAANIAVGNQEKFDPKRTVKTFAVSSITTAAYEGAQNGLYKLNGGKDQILLDKANKEMIQETVPEAERKEVLESYKEAKKISPKTITHEEGKPAQRAKLIKQDEQLAMSIAEREKSFQKVRELQKNAIDHQNKPLVEKYQEHKQKLSAKMAESRAARSRIKTEIKNNKNAFLNKQNAHILTGDKPQQLSLDVNPPGAAERGLKRAVFDYDINNNKNRVELKFAGYTPNHRYSDIPNNGQSDYQKYHTNQENNLRQVRQTNNLVCHQLIEDEED